MEDDQTKEIEVLREKARTTKNRLRCFEERIREIMRDADREAMGSEGSIIGSHTGYSSKVEE